MISYVFRQYEIGAKWFNTSTGMIREWNGQRWVPIHPIYPITKDSPVSKQLEEPPGNAMECDMR